MTVSKSIQTIMGKSSWIRKMFEQGVQLKEQFGAENVFDFSLGNPNVEPPEQFFTALKQAVESRKPGNHVYMPNAGYPDVRRALAEYISKEQQVELSLNEVLVTCGAAGALNVVLKTILDPGDEVIVSAPYFVEYDFYATNHGGVLKTVPTKPDFSLDLQAIEGIVTSKTKAVLINSPNNPTGVVYSQESLASLGALLKTKSQSMGQIIYLISDEPYRKIVYDGVVVPSIFPYYAESLVVTSYSKDLSLAGERIGYLAVNPRAAHREVLVNGMTLSNRILGYVNAPALMQRVIGTIQGASVDIGEYARKRELLCNGLADCGYEFHRPDGAFYLFAKTPIDDDVAFVRALLEERILTVPGSGFGGPGHFRISYCVADETITNAMPSFKKVIDKIRA